MFTKLTYNFLSTTVSTNDEARLLISEKKAKHGIIIRSDFQNGGRGRQSNKWESEKGKNLLISFILEPLQIRPENQFIINELISTVLCSFVEAIIADHAKSGNQLPVTSIKWPNDIFVDDKKIAGILIEHIIIGDQIAYSIIGVGLNINQLMFINAPNAISLKQITGKDFDLEKICRDLSEIFFFTFENFDLCNLHTSYKKMLYHCNKKQRFSIDNKEVEATILGVSKNGMLQLGFEDGTTHTFELNSIKYII